MKRRLSALLTAFLLPMAAIVAVPSPAYAATYCYDVQAFAPSGYGSLYAAGIVNACTQPVQAEIHLREDRNWQPDREISADIRPGVTSVFMEAWAICTPTPFEDHYYFLETRVKVNGSYQQKVQSYRWKVQYFCY